MIKGFEMNAQGRMTWWGVDGPTGLSWKRTRGLITVESQSVTLGCHQVVARADGWACDCRGFEVRGRCTHCEVAVRAVCETGEQIAEVLAKLLDRQEARKSMQAERRGVGAVVGRSSTSTSTSRTATATATERAATLERLFER